MPTTRTVLPETPLLRSRQLVLAFSCHLERHTLLSTISGCSTWQLDGCSQSPVWKYMKALLQSLCLSMSTPKQIALSCLFSIFTNPLTSVRPAGASFLPQLWSKQGREWLYRDSRVGLDMCPLPQWVHSGHVLVWSAPCPLLNWLVVSQSVDWRDNIHHTFTGEASWAAFSKANFIQLLCHIKIMHLKLTSWACRCQSRELDPL